MQPELSVALVGRCPPPYGGVQSHVARARARLAELGVPAHIYGPAPASATCPEYVRVVRVPRWGRWHLHYWGYHWLPQYGLRSPERIIHCHEQWRMAAAVLPLVLRGRQVVMTIHDQMLEQRWQTMRPWDRLASRLLVRQLSAKGLNGYIFITPSRFLNPLIITNRFIHPFFP